MSPYDTMTSLDEPVECPLCMEPFELDDMSFYPCTCGYQICRFCWHRLKTDGNGLCPACRKPYCETPAHFQPLSEDDIIRIKKERRQKEVQKKQKLNENRRHLSDTRVVQKNLVFVVGLSQRLTDIEILKKPEYFGKFGKILKVVVNPSPSYAGSQIPSASAYITYSKPDEALRAIQTVNNIQIDNRTLKASLGTTKYCSHFLKNTQCPKTDCMYLHELGEEAASFTKEEMQQGKHLEYESKLIEQILHIPRHNQNIQGNPHNNINMNINTNTDSLMVQSSTSTSTSTTTTNTTTIMTTNTNTDTQNTLQTKNKWKSNNTKSTHKNGTSFKTSTHTNQSQLSPESNIQQISSSTSEVTTHIQDHDKDIELNSDDKSSSLNDDDDSIQKHEQDNEATHLTTMNSNFKEEIEIDENRLSTTSSDDDLVLNLNTLVTQTNELNLNTNFEQLTFQNSNLYENEKEVDNFITNSLRQHEEEDLGFDPWRESTIALQDLMQYEKDMNNTNQNQNGTHFNNHQISYNHSPLTNEYEYNNHVKQQIQNSSTATQQSTTLPPPGFNSYTNHSSNNYGQNGQTSPNNNINNNNLLQQSIYPNSNSFVYNNGNSNHHNIQNNHNLNNLNGKLKANLAFSNSTNPFNSNGYTDPLTNYLYNSNSSHGTNGSMNDENYNFSLNNLLLNNNSQLKLNDTNNHKSTLDTLRSILPNANISFGQMPIKNTTTTTTSTSNGSHMNGISSETSKYSRTNGSSSTWIEDPAILALNDTSLPNNFNLYNRLNNLSNDKYSQSNTTNIFSHNTQLPNWNFFQQQQQQQNLMQHLYQQQQQQQKLLQQQQQQTNGLGGYSLPTTQHLTALYQQSLLQNGQSSKLQSVLNGSKLALNKSQNLDTK